MFNNLIETLEEHNNTELTNCLEEFEPELNENLDEQIESHQYGIDLHKRLENSNLDNKTVVSALEESFIYDKNIDNEFITSGLEEKMNILKRLYLKTVTYIQALISKFKKWFYKAKTFIYKSFKEFDISHTKNPEGVLIDKNKAQTLIDKFPGLDINLSDIDMQIVNTLQDLSKSIKNLKKDFTELNQNAISEFVILHARNKIRNDVKTGLFGKNFTAKSEIVMISTTLKYGRFMIKETIDGKPYFKTVKINYKDVKPKIPDNFSFKHEDHLTDNNGLFNNLNKIKDDDVITKYFTKADEHTQEILKEIRKLIDKAGEDLTDDLKNQIAYYKELAKNQFAITSDFMKLFYDCLEYLKIKTKMLKESSGKIEIPEKGKIAYWKIYDKVGNFKGRLLGTYHAVFISKTLAMDFLKDIDLTLSELNVEDFHVVTGLKVNADIGTNVISMDNAINKYSKKIQSLDTAKEHVKILQTLNELYGNYIPTKEEEEEIEEHKKKTIELYVDGKYKQVIKEMTEYDKKKGNNTKEMEDILRRDFKWHDKIKNTLDELDTDKKVLIAVGLLHVARDKYDNKDINLIEYIESIGYKLKLSYMKF